jgi:hypothetical protein
MTMEPWWCSRESKGLRPLGGRLLPASGLSGTARPYLGGIFPQFIGLSLVADLFISSPTLGILSRFDFGDELEGLSRAGCCWRNSIQEN